MITKLFLTSFLFTVCLSAPTILSAQSVEEIKAKFSGSDAVLLNNSIAYTIKIKEGKPLIESKEMRQTLYLSSNAASYMSKYNFYHSGFHEIKDYEAYTTTPSGKKIKVTDFKTSSSSSNNIFYDDMKETSFDFPSIEAGSTGTLELSKIHKESHLLTPHYFSHYIPLVKGELKITFPKNMSLRYIIKGTDSSYIKFEEEKRRNDVTYTFRVNNLPPEKRYSNAPDNSYYSLHVIFYIENYVNEKGENVRHLSNVDDLYRLNYGFVNDINKQISPELKSVVDSLTQNSKNLEDKARKIYSWVQKNIKYVAFEAGMEGFIPREANLICARRYGDCKDMSSILTVMLNTAAVPAYYTWIGTRHLPYTYRETPLPIVDNHMICTILLNGQYIFLDGTDANCVFGIPSEGIQSKEALVAINEKEYKILQVPVPLKETNVLVDSTFLELTDKGLSGRINLDLSGYFATDMHQLMNYTNGKDRDKYFKERFNRGSNKFRLNKFDIGDQADPNQFHVKAQFELQDYAKKIGDEWFLNLNLFKHYEHEEIDFPKRKIPMEFPFKFIKKYVTVLTIPEGYNVNELPAGKTFKNDTWGFELKYEQKARHLILTQQFENNHLLLMPDKFPEWNKVLENLFPLYKETINISKK
jgi:hypothetical protein